MSQTKSRKDSRIESLRKKYRREVPKISIERAKHFTESWRKTEGINSRAIRVAMAMKEVYKKMTHYVNREDKIAGYWTESFLGIPLELERGVFHQVLESELSRRDILKFRIKSFVDVFSYLIKKQGVFGMIRTLKKNRSLGPSPINLGLQTMMTREINPFCIDPLDKKILKNLLLPFWKGKTLVDHLEREILQSKVQSGAMRDFARGMPVNTSRQTLMLSTCATIATYQGHVIVDYKRVLQKGLVAIKEEVENKMQEDSALPQDQRDCLLSISLALEGMMIFAKRLSEAIEENINCEADPIKKQALQNTLSSSRIAPLYPAQTFRQAVQASWTIKTALELAHPVNLHSFGRMDQLLYPYYQQDLQGGTLTPEEAREILEELLLKTMSQNIRPESNILSHFYHRYLGSSPITIGGLKPDGSDGTNDLTYLFLEAAGGSRAVTNVSLRVHNNSPEKLYFALADVLHSGSSNLSIFNDQINIEAMKAAGFKGEDSRDYAIMGCVEMLCPGKTGGMSANALLLSRLLDMTLRNGDSQTLMGPLLDVGLKTGHPHSFESFDQLVDAFVLQAQSQIALIVEASNLRDKLFEKLLPAPHISALIEGCVENKRDVTRGGSLYDLSGISFINSIANVVDSLYVIKKLIFEEKKFTLAELLRAMDQNYQGCEDLHQEILSLGGKWGNGNPEVDQLARKITDLLFQETTKYKSHRGGVFVPYIISMTTHTIDGRLSTASPDGRKAATPYAASCNPYNVEKNGITGVLKSVSALDFRKVLGCAVNIKFHPSAIGKSKEARQKWIHLIKTYFQLGGAQLQPTVVSAEILRQAQHSPEDYGDLIIKVGGYSTYFVDLGREIQAEIIARTEHGEP